MRRALLARASEQLDADTPKPAAVRPAGAPVRSLAGWEQFVAGLPDAPALPLEAFDRASLYDR